MTEWKPQLPTFESPEEEIKDTRRTIISLEHDIKQAFDIIKALEQVKSWRHNEYFQMKDSMIERGHTDFRIDCDVFDHENPGVLPNIINIESEISMLLDSIQMDSDVLNQCLKRIIDLHEDHPGEIKTRLDYKKEYQDFRDKLAAEQTNL